MKTWILALCLILAGATANADTTPAQAGFDRIKGLAGTWIGQDDSEGNVEVTFEVASGGHSVIERFEGMVTVYHLDGDSILMTHYCDAGNQPRMRAQPTSASLLDFKFVDVTNLKPGTGHINGLKMELIDETHLSETWTYLGGADGHDHSYKMNLVRKP